MSDAIERLSRWFGHDPSELILIKVSGTDRSSLDHCLIYSKKKRCICSIEDGPELDSLFRDLKSIGVPVVLRSELAWKAAEEDVVDELYDYDIPIEELTFVYQVVWGTAKSEHKDALRSTLEKYKIPSELILKIFALSEQNSG